MDVRYLFYFRLRSSRNRNYLFLAINPKCSFKVIYMPKHKIYVHAIRLFKLELGITNFPPPPS